MLCSIVPEFSSEKIIGIIIRVRCHCKDSTACGFDSYNSAGSSAQTLSRLLQFIFCNLLEQCSMSRWIGFSLFDGVRPGVQPMACRMPSGIPVSWAYIRIYLSTDSSQYLLCPVYSLIIILVQPTTCRSDMTVRIEPPGGSSTNNQPLAG